MAAHHRHVAGIVEDPVLLLVGGVVLLVDDDQAELLERQEQRRACARHHPRRALGDLPPDALAHARRQVGMPFGGLGAETVLEPFEEGVGERDLRQQDQDLMAFLQRRRHGFEIDFRLARPGHAVEQRDREAAGLDRLPQHPGRPALIVAQSRQAEARIGSGDHGPGRDHHRLEHALRLQPVDDGGRDAGSVGKTRAGPGKPAVGRLQDSLARRRHAIGQERCALQAFGPRLGIEGFRRAQQHARHHARRRQRVVRDPVDEAARGAIDRRAIEDRFDRPQLARIDIARRPVPDDARHLPGSERHAHDRTRHHTHS